ncbi:hypothetical protein BJ508DRAFT_331157 [Ascobolus immersus RN42]|uniref:Uncharacterized protein n=1 Tax=Ascobolus immersus RN42 TaxID=1160509 RepID=A0A3N4HRB3_ASCIM|nr:hypothetical protein BJ508DRAFT_331157 [Ascobolus immersus RN42]
MDEAIPNDYTDPHDHSVTPYILRPSPHYPTNHGAYLNTLIQWTDSFFLLDHHNRKPSEWLVPRILGTAFICRINHYEMASTAKLIPQAQQDPVLFVTVYTLSMLHFFTMTASHNDPHWMRAFLYVHSCTRDDIPALLTQLEARYTPQQLQGLADELTHDNPNRELMGHRQQTEDDVIMVDLDTLEPLISYDPQYRVESNQTAMYDGSGPTYIPVPLPNVPAVRITPTSMEVARNVAITMPGVSIWSYDTPPPAHAQQQTQQALSSLEAQMALVQEALLALTQQQHHQPRLMPRPATPIDREITMRDAPSYTTRGALPNILVSPPQENISSTTTSSPFSLHRNLASLTISSPKMPAAPSSLAKPPSRPGSALPSRSPSANASRQQSPTRPQVNQPAGAGSEEPHIETTPKVETADSPKPATSEKSEPDDDHPAPAKVEKTPSPDEHVSPYVKAAVGSVVQANDFQEQYAARLARENAELEQRVLAAETKVKESNQQLHIKQLQKEREALRARLAAADENIVTSHSDHHKMRGATFRELSANKFANSPSPAPMPGAYQEQPSTPSPAPQAIDATLALLQHQAPDALAELQRRLLQVDVNSHVDHSAQRFAQSHNQYAPQGGFRPKLKQIPELAPPGGTQYEQVYTTSPPGGTRGYHQAYVEEEKTPLGGRHNKKHRSNDRGRSESRRQHHQSRQAAGGAPEEPDDPDGSDFGDTSSSGSEASSRRRRRNRRKELPGRPLYVRDQRAVTQPTTRRMGTPAYLGRLHTPALDPEVYEDEATCRAPPEFQEIYRYDPTAIRFNGRTFNDRYDSRRIPVFHEATMPVDNWLTKLHVEVTINGEEAVCPLIGSKALQEGSFLHRWFNNLSHTDLILLTIGPRPWRNWQYAIYNLREHLNPLIRHQAETRIKAVDETYHSYVTTRYTLLKAAFPYEPEVEILRRIKSGFQDQAAFTIMRESKDIRKLEQEALEYEEMQTTMSKNRPVVTAVPHSSYLRVQGTPTPSVPEHHSQSFAAESKGSYRRSNTYQQTPATKMNVYPVPAQVVKAEDLHPDLKKNRRTLPPDQIDPRALTVNKRKHPQTGEMIRCYIRENSKYVGLDRPCSICQRLGLKPDDHFSFEHNLYHDDTTGAAHVMNASFEFGYQSSSEESGNDNEM